MGQIIHLWLHKSTSYIQVSIFILTTMCALGVLLKVVVNQDKASKQMNILRQEIQKLSLELMEYKQVLLSVLIVQFTIHHFTVCLEFHLNQFCLW